MTSASHPRWLLAPVCGLLGVLALAVAIALALATHVRAKALSASG